MSEDRRLREKLKDAYPADPKEPIPGEMLEIVKRAHKNPPEKAEEKKAEEKPAKRESSPSHMRGSSHMFLVIGFLTELA